jgi:hypothetical protein
MIDSAGCMVWLPQMEEANEAIMRSGFGWDPSIFLKSGTKVLQKADGMTMQ